MGMLRFGLIVAAVVLGLDQVTKLAADVLLDPYRPVPVLPFLNLTLGYNPGAAFSLLAEQAGWQRWFFVAVALAVSGYLIWWLRQLAPAERWQALGLGLVLGGAVGNVVDRLLRGEVVDFVDLHYGGWHWPAFNVADSAITLGVAVMIVTVLGELRPRR